MAGNENTIELNFKMNDQGSIVIDKINSKLNDIEQNTGKMNKALSLVKLDSMINLGERAFHTAEQIYGVAKSAASALNDIDRLSKVAGMSSEQFQKMTYAAKMMDVESEDLAVGMKRLSVNMEEASRGVGDAARVFDEMGISVKEPSGNLKSLDTIMMQIADKFSTWTDGPRKIAIAVDLFGRSGERLVPYLNKGSAGIREFYQEAEKLGVILDDSLIKKGSELEDRLKKAEAAITSWKNKFVIGIYEVIEALKKYRSLTDTMEFSVTGGARKKTGRPDLTEAEAAGSKFLELESFYKRTAPPGGKDESKFAEFVATLGKKTVDQLSQEKTFREVNLQLLKDQESTLQRMISLQERLNKESSEAIDISERLGIGTKAGLTQWINKDIVGEYEKLLGSKLFSEEEMGQFKEKYIGALEYAQGPGGWGAGVDTFRQIEEAIRRINTMTVEETGLEKVRNEFADMQRSLKYLETFTGKIKLDDDQLIAASTEVDGLRKKLIEISNQEWKINFLVTGTGSSELPIMEKIDQISRAFETMGSDVGNMVLTMNLSQIGAQIQRLSGGLARDVSSPYSLESPGMNAAYWASQTATRQRIGELQSMYDLLSKTQWGASGGGGVGYGGSGGGGVSISIGNVTILGTMDRDVAEKLDEFLGELWIKDRSKLKRAIGLS